MCNTRVHGHLQIAVVIKTEASFCQTHMKQTIENKNVAAHLTRDSLQF